MTVLESFKRSGKRRDGIGGRIAGRGVEISGVSGMPQNLPEDCLAGILTAAARNLIIAMTVLWLLRGHCI